MNQRVEPDAVSLCADCPDKEPVRPVEHLNWQVETTVEKYDAAWTAEEIAEGRAGQPIEVVRDHGNLLMNVGAQRLIDQLIGVTTLPFDNTHCRLGVGDSSTAVAASQTDLQAAAGATHRQFKMMDATYPSRSDQTMTFKATFASGEAQFAWNEWCIDQGTADGTTVTAPMLNRKVPSGGLGTKGAVSWVLTVAITPS